MTVFFGTKRLTKLEDWRDIVGKKKWKKDYSAYELAYAWQTAGGLPKDIRKAFDHSGHKELFGLLLEECLVEKPVFLDSKKAPSITDLMAYGRNKSGDPILIGVEGKAKETFGPRVSEWLRYGSRKNHLDRLLFLGSQLGKVIEPDSTLRYQLLHRTVSVVLESQKIGAKAAIVLVHAFGLGIDQNQEDFSKFLEWLGDKDKGKGNVSGPHQFGKKGSLSTYFLWWQQSLSHPLI